MTKGGQYGFGTIGGLTVAPIRSKRNGGNKDEGSYIYELAASL